MMRTYSAEMIIILLFGLLFGCNNGGVAKNSAIVQKHANIPPECSQDAISAVVLRFLDALATDNTDLHAFIDANFKWYSLTEILDDSANANFVTYNAQDFMTYIQQRRQMHERFELNEITVREPRNTPDSIHVVDVSYTLTHQTDDRPSEQSIIGKGAIKCPEHTIVVWSMAVRK